MRLKYSEKMFMPLASREGNSRFRIPNFAVRIGHQSDVSISRSLYQVCNRQIHRETLNGRLIPTGMTGTCYRRDVQFCPARFCCQLIMHPATRVFLAEVLLSISDDVSWMLIRAQSVRRYGSLLPRLYASTSIRASVSAWTRQLSQTSNQYSVSEHIFNHPIPASG